MAGKTTFDHYEVLQRDDGSLWELGRGAMGITYKALDANLHTEVALKVINTATLTDEVARANFVQEARAAAQLRNRHVASVFHLGQDGEICFYAMEFIDGETIDALVKRDGAVAPELAFRIAAQIARALAAAEKHGLVHRDIKPANVMLVREEEELVAKVIDFGLALSTGLADTGDDVSTRAPGFFGTPHFASPEQLEERPLDLRSDIYSLGMTLWFMLAGRPAFGGPVAQVMSAQLRQAPPWSQLPALPEKARAVLRAMLEKDRARRPQTPADLRAELDQVLAALAAAPIPSSAPAAPPRPAPGRPISPATTPPLVATRGTLLADQYEVLAAGGEGNTGRFFRARAVATGELVRIIQLKPELFSSTGALTQLEREVEKAVAAPHPNLLRTFGLECVETTSLLVLAWTEGFSLMDLLRSRRELAPSEVLRLLDQATAGVDYALGAGLRRLDFSLHQMLCHFPGGAENRAELLRLPLDEWPPFELKLNPLGITQELSLSDTWAGGQTIVGNLPTSTPRESTAADLPSRYVQSLAAMTYELLGGTLSPLMLARPNPAAAPRYIPLASLPEAGNEVLRRALDPARSFIAARQFFEALHELDGLATRKPETVHGTRFATKDPAHPAGATSAPAAAPLPRATGAAEETWKPADPSQLGRYALAGAVALIGVLMLVVLLFIRQSPTTDSAPVAVIASTPVPALATPAPTTQPTARPTLPPPDQQELMKHAIREAEAAETSEDWAAALAGYLHIAHDFPGSDTGRVRLQLLLEKLRSRPKALTPFEFESLREAITAAAHLNVVAAMMILGDQLRRDEPKAAFDWLCAAADLGQPQAYTQVGLMYSNGLGVPRDLEKATWWFREASERGDVAGKTCLAECYLYGKGLAKDEPKAVQILLEAVDAGDPRAMNLLGTCDHRGTGTPTNFDEARRLFNRAQELGFLDGLGNLGVLYMNGDGVAQDRQKAVDFFLSGAKRGNGYCMFLYARCLESGSGLEPNPAQAEIWYRKSAEAGYPRATDWLRQQNLPLPTHARTP